MGVRVTGVSLTVCKAGVQNWRNILSSQIVLQLFPHNQLASSSSWCWKGGGVSGADQEGYKEENQARIEEQRASQVLKYALWKEESPKMPQSHRLRLETWTILLKVYLRNKGKHSHLCTGARERGQ